MAKELIEFMDDALVDDTLLTAFTDKFNQLYDANGNPIVADPDQKLSDWFDQKNYKISKGQCKKMKAPFVKAKGKVVPEY
ncbi:MAG: hypothetical protein MUO43_18120 [Desulfobacterales bacterium]|jgi:hypothetical protein|nr:hypothetical protein [Desulfobacterales bacterium]